MFVIKSICKGGGYDYCRTEPKHPKANSKGLYPLHRVIAEIKIGRLLLPGEDVHHKNEDKFDNHPDNLEVITKADHAKLHAKKIPLIEIYCGHCQSPFKIHPRYLRLRLSRNKSKSIFCSRSCGTRATHK